MSSGSSTRAGMLGTAWRSQLVGSSATPGGPGLVPLAPGRGTSNSAQTSCRQRAEASGQKTQACRRTSWSQLSLAQPAPVAVSRASSAVPLSWAVTPAPSQLLAQLPLYMSPGREAGALCLPWLPHVCSAEELGAWCSPPAVRRGPVGLGADGRGPCSHPGPTWQSPHSPIAQGPESLCFLPGPRRKPKSPWALGRPGATGVLGKPPWGKAHPVFLLCSAHAAACSPA